MKLLAFETATEACSVAVWDDGRVLERFAVAPRRHAELALPWAEAVLADAGIVRAQLDAIAVGRGPGAFTGVRLAIGLAQGIALALALPVVPVSTLAALALRAPADAGHILSAIDARMSEVYTAAFRREGEGVAALSDERVCAPDAVELPAGAQRWDAAGTGLAALDGALQKRLQPQLGRVDAAALPHAADVARLAALDFAAGRAVAAERIEPAYLRNNVALTLEEQRARCAARS